MNRFTALLIAAALWAGIFLPGLGSTELKGEEGRRIMPAVTMMEGGSWLVPYVGGKPFLRKPPLVQWCIAGSMKIFGRNAWAARLPSALSVLALAAVMIFCTRGWLITEQSLLAAIVMMTQVATIEKCRLAELDAIYVALSGIAMVLWMSWWSQGRSPWLVWIVPMLFNGLALLAKAPLHLLFFYAVVVAALVAAREARQLLTAAHGIGLAVMAIIFLAWLLPFHQQVDPAALAKTAGRQMIERFTGAEFDVGNWAMSLPNTISNHLPWILFLPLFWRRDADAGQHERTAALLRGGRWALLGCFLLVAVPGMLPRYVQPLVAPFSVLLAPVLWDCPRRIRHWWRYSAFGMTLIVFFGAVFAPFAVAGAVARGGDALPPAVAGLGVLLVFAGTLMLVSLRRRLHEAVHLALWTALIAVMAMVLFATCAAPWMRLKEDIRPFAESMDAAMPEGGTIVAYSIDDYAPLLASLFYLKTPFIYAPDVKSAPAGEAIYLVRGKDWEKFSRKFRLIGEPLVARVTQDEKEPSVLVRAVRIE